MAGLRQKSQLCVREQQKEGRGRASGGPPGMPVHIDTVGVSTTASAATPPHLCCCSLLCYAPFSSPSFSPPSLLFAFIVCYNVFYVCAGMIICLIASETAPCRWQLTVGLNLQRAESCCVARVGSGCGVSGLCCHSVFFPLYLYFL